jgi:hypothetical protein
MDLNLFLFRSRCEHLVVNRNFSFDLLTVGAVAWLLWNSGFSLSRYNLLLWRSLRWHLLLLRDQLLYCVLTTVVLGAWQIFLLIYFGFSLHRRFVACVLRLYNVLDTVDVILKSLHRLSGNFCLLRGSLCWQLRRVGTSLLCFCWRVKGVWATDTAGNLCDRTLSKSGMVCFHQCPSH